MIVFLPPAVGENALEKVLINLTPGNCRINLFLF